MASFGKYCLTFDVFIFVDFGLDLILKFREFAYYVRFLYNYMV